MVTRRCLGYLRRWRDDTFLLHGVPLSSVPARREVVTTDASPQGWGAVWQQRSVQGVWCSQWRERHINVLELSGAEALLALSQGKACAHSDGQHLNGVSHQSSGGDQIPGVPKGGPATVVMGLSSVCLNESDAPARQSELCGGLSLSSEAAPWGVEIASPGGTDDLGTVWGSPCRFVRLREHDPLSTVVLPGRDQCPTWDGCPRQHLAEWSPLCISADPPVIAHASQGEIIRSQDSLGGPQVALETMVFDAPQSVGWGPLSAPIEGGPPVPVGREGLASISDPSSALGLAIEKDRSLLTEFDHSICDTLHVQEPLPPD